MSTTTQFTPPAGQQLLNAGEVTQRLRCHANTLDRLIATGAFPTPIRYGPPAHGRKRWWLVATVEAWLAGQAGGASHAAS